ncbi:MAG: 50S ribosomal protein L21 [Syntrophomonadaceae bacterium]|jgi:large subunit ribosomal protein L21|nr:50S ribosomal protein L21 [Syntrophomonadaceae bacterium]
MYAVIETGGKQYRVKTGDVLAVEKLDAEVGSRVEITRVLTVKKDTVVKVGLPYVQGARVVATVLEHGRDKKITVFKYKPKKNYKRKQGHRQPFTRIRVEEIVM